MSIPSPARAALVAELTLSKFHKSDAIAVTKAIADLVMEILVENTNSGGFVGLPVEAPQDQPDLTTKAPRKLRKDR